jgi:hypothetical protein
MSKFKKELEVLINKHSIENESNTPDFILANYIAMCLDAYNVTLKSREEWYGRNIENKQQFLL